jgi:hypothetical protein
MVGLGLGPEKWRSLGGVYTELIEVLGIVDVR